MSKGTLRLTSIILALVMLSGCAAQSYVALPEPVAKASKAPAFTLDGSSYTVSGNDHLYVEPDTAGVTHVNVTTAEQEGVVAIPATQPQEFQGYEGAQFGMRTTPDEQDAAQTSTQSAAEPTSPPSPTPAPTKEPIPELIVPGTLAWYIADIQQRLMDLNYMDYDEPTELFGPATQAAVEKFQFKNDLTVDGYIGAATYELLFSDRAKKYTITIGDKGEDVLDLQKRLKELDYIEQADSVFGEVTEAAVKKFQERNGLTVDGKVGAVTLEKLYSENVKANVLSYGDESADIKKYQQRLKELGYLTTTPDGNYGNDTVAAIKRFQSVNGLIVDGHLGPTTKDTLMSGSAVANSLAIGSSGDDVKRVQKRLIELKYLNGSADGYFGGGTDAAVKAFQKANGLSADGKVGPLTMNKLTSSSAKKGSGGSSSSSSLSSSSGGGSSSADVPSASNGAGVEAFVSAALSRLGCPYVKAGKGPDKFDCSGLVYWALNQAGVTQSYLTSSGWRNVSKYQRIGSLSSVERGDVIVFKGHVAIGLGGGMMVDASSNNGKVVQRSCTGSWSQRNFICAYRIF